MQRKIPFANGEYHHIFNRGVDKREIFLNQSDYERFFISMYLLNSQENDLMSKWLDFKKFNPKVQPWEFKKINPKDNLVEFSCYCLNSNHYHFILKQIQDRGIELFMHKLGTSHTMYFNKKYERNGSLFQGRFKSVHVSSNDQLLYLSAYVNKNRSIHGYKESERWEYSSLNEYLNKNKLFCVCNKNSILEQFISVEEYKNYMDINSLRMIENKELKKMALE